MEEVPFSLPEVRWPRYFLRIAYNGGNYHGWQRQINGHSVQAELEKALRTLLRQEKVITTGCGRTDTGVHARSFFVHFNAQDEITDSDDIVRRLNKVLPNDIAVYELFRVPDLAHARFDAVSRIYEYFLHQLPDPFLTGQSMYYPWPLDMDAMNEAALLLIGKGDFASFCKAGGTQKTTLCVVTHAAWVQEGYRMIFRISADRFLRNMVRAVVGTLLDVGRNKLSVAEFSEVIHGKQRSLAGESVNACGLFLTEVNYPGSIRLETREVVISPD
jgi:tRNA pseudouridine38-40 synthase